jgi:polyisoprenoid-binding protein YceI
MAGAGAARHFGLHEARHFWLRVAWQRRLGAALAAPALSAALVTPVSAAATRMAPIPLTPPATRIGYTAFALGLLPINAAFQDFAGTLTIDPGQPPHCHVQVTVQMASLRMADPVRDRLALSPAMLDAARYPTMRFTGHCEGADLVGDLTLHGVTHKLTMTVQRTGRHVVATATLLRRDYDISSLSGLLSQRVRVRLDAQLPDAAGPLPAP